MGSSPYIYRPKDLVAAYPSLESPARELGLLEHITFQSAVPLDDLPKRLFSFFPDARIETMQPGSLVP